jgi:hypothetical protein
MEQAHQFSERLFLSTGQAARYCISSIPALKRRIRDGWFATFKTPEGHCRIALEELQRFLRQHGILPGPISAPYICILIIDDDPSIVKLFADILADDPWGFHLDTATAGYDVMSFNETKAFFPNAATLIRVKGLQRACILQLTQGDYDEAYLANRLHIGQVHQQIGLEPRWYMGAYALYRQLALAAGGHYHVYGHRHRHCTRRYAEGDGVIFHYQGGRQRDGLRPGHLSANRTRAPWHD